MTESRQCDHANFAKIEKIYLQKKEKKWLSLFSFSKVENIKVEY